MDPAPTEPLAALAGPAPWDHVVPDKKKQGDDSQGKEERASTLAMVAELIECEAHDPGKLIRRGHWDHLGFWTGRAAAAGGLTALVVLSESAWVLGLTAAALPLLLSLSMGAHLDQFRGDRPLEQVGQVRRWLPVVLDLVPAYLVFLLLLSSLGVLLSVGDTGPLLLGLLLPVLGLAGLLIFAWGCTVSERVLLNRRGSEAISLGIYQATRLILLTPFHTFLWATTFRWSGAPRSGERQLLSTLLTGGLNFYIMALIALGAAALLNETGLWRVSQALTTFLSAGIAGAMGTLVLEYSAGVWTHQYLAACARIRFADQLEASQRS